MPRKPKAELKFPRANSMTRPTRINTYLEDEDVIKLDLLAEKEKRSRSELMRILLTGYLKGHETKGTFDGLADELKDRLEQLRKAVAG